MNTNYIPLSIIIPSPCHENWDTMSAVDQGRFCGSCHKTVHDFTEKSDQEVRTFFTEHQNQKVCGRFRGSQVANQEVDRNMFLYKLYAVAGSRSIRRNLVRYSFMLLIGALISLALYNQTSAQSGLVATAPPTMLTGTSVAPAYRDGPKDQADNKSDTTKKNTKRPIKGDVAITPLPPALTNETSHIIMGGARPSQVQIPEQQPKLIRNTPKHPKDSIKNREPMIMGKMSIRVDPEPVQQPVILTGDVSIKLVEQPVEPVQPIQTTLNINTLPFIREMLLAPPVLIDPPEQIQPLKDPEDPVRPPKNAPEIE